MEEKKRCTPSVSHVYEAGKGREAAPPKRKFITFVYKEEKKKEVPLGLKIESTVTCVGKGRVEISQE